MGLGGDDADGAAAIALPYSVNGGVGGHAAPDDQVQLGIVGPSGEADSRCDDQGYTTVRRSSAGDPYPLPRDTLLDF